MWWGEALGRSAQMQLTRVGRMRRALALLALLACSAAVVLYWRQQADDEHRPMHGMYT